MRLSNGDPTAITGRLSLESARKVNVAALRKPKLGSRSFSIADLRALR